MDLRTLGALTVAQLLPALDGGGVERGTLEVAGALVRAGHRSLVISGGGRLVASLEAAGSRHVRWPIGRKSPLTLRRAAALRRLLEQEHVDILHARSRLPAWVAWLAWRDMPVSTRPRFITTVHGLYAPGVYSSVMLRGERVIAVSNQAREYLLSVWPDTDPERVRVIPRGVDTRAYYPGYRPGPSWLDDWYRACPQTRGRFLVTLPGRITRSKGVLDFIEIVRRLRDRNVPVHGLIVGAPPAGRHRLFGARLRRQLRAAGLQDRITLTGQRADLREILAISGAVVSLSQHPEAFGRTVNEALALGRPVAGYAHGGVGEQLATHFPAGGVPPGDRVCLAGRLADWSRQAPVLPPLRPPALEDMLRDTLRIYEECAADG